jgi:hypothetical protein
VGIRSLGGLLGISHNGHPRPLSEPDVRLRIYGDHPSRNGRPALKASDRPRDARGRFVARSTAGHAGSQAR